MSGDKHELGKEQEGEKWKGVARKMLEEVPKAVLMIEKGKNLSEAEAENFLRYTLFDAVVCQKLEAFQAKEGANFIGHDVNQNVTNSNLDLINYSPNAVEKLAGLKEYLLEHRDRILEYVYVMEDVLHHMLYVDKIPMERQKEFGFQHLQEVLRYFKATNEKIWDERERESKGITKGIPWLRLDMPDGLLKEDEVLKGTEGLYLRALENVVRNARKDLVGATNVMLQIKRDGDELVARVIDDGCGLPPSRLDKKSDKFIFLRGVSGVSEDESGSSSGLGLAEMLSRFQSVGADLSVSTWLQPVKFASDKKESKMERDLFSYVDNKEGASSVEEETRWREHTKGQCGFIPSTKFEFRMPIFKKKK